MNNNLTHSGKASITIEEDEESIFIKYEGFEFLIELEKPIEVLTGYPPEKQNHRQATTSVTNKSPMGTILIQKENNENNN